MRARKTVKGLAIAGLAVWLFSGSQKDVELAALPEPASSTPPPAPQEAEPVVEWTTAAPVRSWRRRTVTTLVFTALFFAGAALSAGAGNELAHIDAGSTDAAAVDAATDATTTDVTTDVTTDATTTTDAATTTTTDETTTEETTTTTEPVAAPEPVDSTEPVETVETVETATAAEPDPSDATPVKAARPAVTPDPAPAPAAAPPAAPVVAHRTAAPAPPHVGAPASVAPTASPFPVVAFDPQLWLVDHPGTPTGDAAVAIAERYLGVPYLWGGNKPSTGFDCSGLTQFVYAQLGVWLPHYAAAQFLAYQRLDPSQLQPGDLVFFEPKADGPGHVAIYAGNDKIVEAPHTGALVRIGSLSGAAASLGFLGAVRPSDGAIPVAPVRRVASAPVRHQTTDDPGVALALLR